MNSEFAELLADVFGLPSSEIQPDLQQGDLATWDSLKQMDLVMSLEREYYITLEISDIVRMTSVAEIMAVLTAKGVDPGN